MPLFAWAWLVTGVMIVFAFSTLFGATVLIELDRAMGTCFFNPECGGNTLLWQHLFWFFGHPDVYVMFIPATGIVLAVGRPLLPWILYGVTLWLWHVPALYEAALRDRMVHDIQHLSFFLTSALFWGVLFHPSSRLRLDYGAGILYLFVASLHSTALGALMAVSPRLWYGHYGSTTAPFGIGPVEDQRLAGYIMWMPAGVGYVAAAAVLAFPWINRSEYRS